MIASAPMQVGEAGQLALAQLSEQQFVHWARLLEQRLGIAVTAQRKGFLSSKLRSRMRELSVADFEEYYRLVTESPQAAMEWSHLLDLLTVHETRFNRQPASFNMLVEQVFPSMLQAAHGDTLNIKAWSVGCASGEEAYYLAILLDQALSSYPGKGYFGVFGSDVSLESLAIARRGVYPASRLIGLDEHIVRGGFVQLDNGDYQVQEQLRQRVAFSQLNVQELAQAPFDKVDIIFCQNLLIYFAQKKRHEIVECLAHFLKPGGVLVLGVGEIVGWVANGLEPIKIKDTLAYRKIKDLG